MPDGACKTNEQLWTIDELIRSRAQQFRKRPLLCYPKSGILDFEEHSAFAIDGFVDAAVLVLQQRGFAEVDAALDEAPVVGLLAQSSLAFIITLLALGRLGYTSLLLSTRLAGPALERLLALTGCRLVLTTSQFHPVLAEVKAKHEIRPKAMLAHEDYDAIKAPAFIRKYEAAKETCKRAVIIHSSGSTGLPKPIYLTHRSCIAAFQTHLDRRALMTQPLFHSFGFYETFRSIYSGKPMYYYNYAFAITSQNLLSVLEHVKPDLLFCVPYILKLLGETERGTKGLAAIDLIMYGGSACPDDLGDTLVREGVNIAANYGATETGRLMTSVRHAGDKAWNYLRILPQVEQYVWMKPIGASLYECVALDGLRSKSTVNSQEPSNSFHTKDLFTPHPLHQNWWKFVSRLDDRLTLVNGEKVLPIPIEGRIRQEPSVQEAVVFGDGKTIPGIIIVRSKESSHPSNEEFLGEVWPAVEIANSRAESFSRIPKDLILILPANTEYPKTDKGTFIRAQMYAQFDAEIRELYEKFDSGVSSGTMALSTEQVEQYLIGRFDTNCGINLPSKNTDFFTFGIDSLQCMKMWGSIMKELDLGGKQTSLGQNILYETGTIANLARHLHNLRTGNEDRTDDYKTIMDNLVTKYSNVKAFHNPGFVSNSNKAQQQVMILTGATGSLGAHLLAQLVRRPEVVEIWCLTRAPSRALALDRVVQSLTYRALKLTPTELMKVVAVPADFSDARFGLEQSMVEDLLSKLTLVIHSAWAVNFKVSVQSFEDQHIRSVQSFIDLCQSTTHGSQAHFFFCSSVSTAAATPRPGVVPEKKVDNIAYVQDTGYARSKYVAEHIVERAATMFGAKARVLRIGQLSGDTISGEWNITEGVPLMIQTAITLGTLPELDEEMSWLPVDAAASAILDVSLPCVKRAVCDGELVYHIINPQRFHWARDMLPALSDAGLQFEPRSTDEWMATLRASERDPVRNPPIKLLDWFESKYGHKKALTRGGVLEYCTEVTRRDSPTLANVKSVANVPYMTKVIMSLQRHWTLEA